MATLDTGEFSSADSFTSPPYAVRQVHYYLVSLNIPVINKIVTTFVAIQVGGGASLLHMIAGSGNRVMVVVLQKLMIGETVVLAGNGIGWNNPASCYTLRDEICEELLQQIQIFIRCK